MTTNNSNNQTRYIVSSEQYGDSQEFDSIEAVREMASQLWDAFGREGDEAEFVADFVAAAEEIEVEAE